MTKVKALTIALALLAILNVAMLMFFTGHKPPHHHPGPMKEIIARLDLDEDQIAQYERLIEKHKKEVWDKESESNEFKQSLYALLSSDDRIEKSDQLIQAIAKSQSEIEQIHFLHFQDLKALCRPDQMDDFTALSNELIKLFARPRGNREKRK